ncbi:MAG: FadR/GntR family transcriptional regulator [Minwuia sp.]|uniref:FadR/GntR family transcriptional regulator n=1 Tax=Minwuia sp. TaxID=2493630 RepID=UPI003A8BD224
MADIGRIQAKKGFETLAEELREQILDGRIPPGQVLNEREIVEKSGLSRGSVREAFRVLETEGLMSTRRGRNGGRIALQLDGDVLKRSLDLFIRGQQVPASVLAETIEVFAPALADLAARHRTDEDIAEMRDLLDRLERISDSPRFVRGNIQWHLALARAGHNPVLASIYQVIGPDLLTPRPEGFANKQIRQNTVNAERRVLDAIADGDAALARRRMEKHILAYNTQIEMKSG